MCGPRTACAVECGKRRDEDTKPWFLTCVDGFVCPTEVSVTTTSLFLLGLRRQVALMGLIKEIVAKWGSFLHRVFASVSAECPSVLVLVMDTESLRRGPKAASESCVRLLSNPCSSPSLASVPGGRVAICRSAVYWHELQLPGAHQL